MYNYGMGQKWMVVAYHWKEAALSWRHNNKKWEEFYQDYCLKLATHDADISLN